MSLEPVPRQADHVPDVDDRVVLARDHERLEVDDVAVLVEDQPAEQHPRAVVAAGAEAPLAGERVAALGHRGLARRRVRRAQPRVGVLAPDRLLRLVREQRHLPRVHADHAGDPAGRAARAGDVADRCVERDRVGLEAVEPLGLEQPEEPDLLQLLDRRLRDDAQALGLVGPVTERGQQVSDPVETTQPGTFALSSSCGAAANTRTRSSLVSMPHGRGGRQRRRGPPPRPWRRRPASRSRRRCCRRSGFRPTGRR